MPEFTPNHAPNNVPHPVHSHALGTARSRLFDAPTLRAFDGAHASIQLLEAAVDQANIDARRLEHLLVTGPAGSGKQVLARVIVRELAQRALEIEAECIDSVSHLMELVRSLSARDVLLVRRIDGMHKRLQRALAVMLSEHRAPRSARQLRAPFARRDPEAPREAIVDVTLIATAEDTGRVLPILRQHVELEVTLSMPDEANYRAAVRRAFAAFGLELDTEAQQALATLCIKRAAAGGTSGALLECTVRELAICAREQGMTRLSRQFIEDPVVRSEPFSTGELFWNG